jgi:hypothetical protein
MYGCAMCIKCQKLKFCRIFYFEVTLVAFYCSRIVDSDSIYFLKKEKNLYYDYLIRPHFKTVFYKNSVRKKNAFPANF